MSDWFYEDQLLRHLNSFHDEKHKVLITLAPEPMDAKKEAAFEEKLQEYNKQQTSPVIHINTTFEELANAVGEVLEEDRDYEMEDVLDDYLDYCYKDGLIPTSDSWKYMRVQLAGTTLHFNVTANVYYDNADRGFRAHDVLGLYKNKSVRAVGKVIARITAVETAQGIQYNAEFGELTEERKATIEKAMDDAASYGYDLRTVEHRYFFVEKFYETDFKKITPKAPMGTRIFDLTQILGMDKIPDMEKLAAILREKTWT